MFAEKQMCLKPLSYSYKCPGHSSILGVPLIQEHVASQLIAAAVGKGNK